MVVYNPFSDNGHSAKLLRECLEPLLIKQLGARNGDVGSHLGPCPLATFLAMRPGCNARSFCMFLPPETVARNRVVGGSGPAFPVRNL